MIETLQSCTDAKDDSHTLQTKPEETVYFPQVEDRPGQEERRYLGMKQLILVFLGFLVSVLLVTLDQTIIATALPKIVSHFDALQDVTWVATAYFLTQGGCILIFGQILTITRKRNVFLFAITLFELGSLLCGVSKSMSVLIFGRAVAGCGGSGIQISVATMIPEVAPLEIRPLLFACFGAILGISAVAGPLLGGVLTDKVSWRWCFYINLPFGGLAVLLVLLFMRYKDVTIDTPGLHKSTYRRWMSLDWIGAILGLGTVTCLLLALQWGGNTRPWNDPTVIALFVVFGVLAIIFGIWEHHQGPGAMLPLSILKCSTQIGCIIAGFLEYMALLLATYYLPLWYQARGHSAVRSGVDILPFLISVVIAAGVSGAVITKYGRYWWFLLLCPLLLSIGGGLLFTLDVDSPLGHLIGYQILYGVGIGGAFQNVLIAVQAEYAIDERLIPQATSVVSFAQILGGIVGIAIAGSIFQNQLRSNLALDAPQLPPDLEAAVLQSVTVISTLPSSLRAGVLVAYVHSLDPVFLISVPAGALAALSTWLIANHNLKERSTTSGHVIV